MTTLAIAEVLDADMIEIVHNEVNYKLPIKLFVDLLVANGAIWTKDGNTVYIDGLDSNVFLGDRAGESDNLTDKHNTFIGTDAGNKNVSGHQITAIGDGALGSGVDVPNQVAVGVSALQNHTAGWENVAVGNFALSNSVTGSRCVGIGNFTELSADDATNEIVIGKGAVGQGSNAATIGNADLTDLYANQNGDATVHLGVNQMKSLDSLPTSPVIGMLCVHSGVLKFYDGAWKTVNLT